MLAHQLRQELLHGGSRVLDLCTGSGFLAIVAAQSGAEHVTAVDISRRAILATHLNARLNGARITAVRGDLFGAVPAQRFDMIVSNPPYLVSEDARLPRRGARRAWDAGPSGRAFLDRICRNAHHHLTPGGVLLLVHSSLCSEQATIDALTGLGYEVRISMRHRGPLGERMRTRLEMLRRRGLVGEAAVEEIFVVRAQWPGRGGPGVQSEHALAGPA
jgi:release factor glutamine methyltransferase